MSPDILFYQSSSRTENALLKYLVTGDPVCFIFDHILPQLILTTVLRLLQPTYIKVTG